MASCSKACAGGDAHAPQVPDTAAHAYLHPPLRTPDPAARMILYLHGFRSSPQSFKAQWLAGRMAALGCAQDYLCPQLPPHPQEAIALARQLAQTAAPADLTLIGSSLGGYYATYLAEQLGCRAVLLNPALRAFEKLAAHTGPQTAYHPGGADFDFKPAWLDELRQMHVPVITQPARYFLVAATGDELLNWREMVAAYPGAHHKVIQGSDHGLSDFAQYANEILEFSMARSPLRFKPKTTHQGAA